MTNKVLHSLLALLLSACYLMGSLELDQDEFKAHYQQEQISALCTAPPVHLMSAATVVMLFAAPPSFCPLFLPEVLVGGFVSAWLLREPAPPGRRYLRFRVLRL